MKLKVPGVTVSVALPTKAPFMYTPTVEPVAAVITSVGVLSFVKTLLLSAPWLSEIVGAEGAVVSSVYPCWAPVVWFPAASSVYVSTLP